MIGTVLMPHDLLSPVWLKLARHVEERIVVEQKKLEQDLDPIATAKVRARIRTYRDLLALGDSPAPALAADGSTPPSAYPAAIGR